MSYDELFDALCARIGPASATRRAAGDPVSAAQIRQWQVAFGDDNPACLDAVAARAAGRAGPFAPAGMLAAFSNHSLREARQVDDGLGVVAPMLAGLNLLPAGVNIAQHYRRDILVGDWLREVIHVESVSARKRTRLGDGYFVAIQSRFINQDEEDVGAQQITILAYPPGPAGLSPGPSTAPPPVEEPDHAGAERLPPMAIYQDRVGIITCCMACGDYAAAHYDPDIARERGFADIFADVYSAIGFVHRFITQWAGPAARVRMIDLRLGAPWYAGDTLALSGTVQSRAADGTAQIAVRGTCRTGVHVQGLAQIG